MQSIQSEGIFQDQLMGSEIAEQYKKKYKDISLLQRLLNN
jgi:hypothetical protein